MSENFSVGESQFSSAGAVSDLSLTSVSDAAYSMPATFETSMVSAGAVSPAGGTLDFAPLPGYDTGKTVSTVATDTPSVVKPEVETRVAVDSAHFKSDNLVRYQTSDKLPAITSDRAQLGTGESPRINVGPQSGNADILVGKDGTVSLAQGLSGKTLKEYNVQVEAGADSKITEKALTDLGAMIKAQSPDVLPRLNVAKGASGEDLVSSEFRDGFRDKFEKAPVDKTLPDGQSDLGGGGGGCDGGGGGGGGCDRGGGGGGGGGGGELPETDNTDTNDKSINDRRTDVTNNGRFSELAGKLTDMNPVKYSNWMADVMPDGFMEEMGPPPWDPKKLAAYMAKHAKEIQEKMGKRASALDKQGDKEGSKAINDFAAGFEKTANNPAALEAFAGTFANFAERAESGKANPADVHAMFDNNSNLEGAIRRSQMLESAKKYDTSAGGDADLSKLSPDNAASLIADLQRAPVPKVKPLEGFSILPQK